MPETCEIWPGFVNSCIYYACQTREMYQVLPCLVDFKATMHEALESTEKDSTQWM